MKVYCRFAVLREATLVVVASCAFLANVAPAQSTNTVTYHVGQATMYASMRNWDKMVAECDEALRLNPDAIDAYRGRGAAYHEKGDFNNVISNYSQVVRLSPNDANAYSYLGYAYSQMGSFDKAIQNYTKCLTLDPSLSAEYCSRASAYSHQGEFDKAISDYDEAIKRNPHVAEAYYGRGYCYGAKWNVEKAISDFSDAIRLDPNRADSYFHRGYAYSSKREFGAAINDYGKACQLEPTNVMFCNSLAWLLATCPDAPARDGMRSVQMATKACEQTTFSSWGYLDTLAAAYAETGDFTNALKYQQTALKMEGATNSQDHARLIRRLELYQQHKPYHEALKP